MENSNPSTQKKKKKSSQVTTISPWWSISGEDNYPPNEGYSALWRKTKHYVARQKFLIRSIAVEIDHNIQLVWQGKTQLPILLTQNLKHVRQNASKYLSKLQFHLQRHQSTLDSKARFAIFWFRSVSQSMQSLSNTGRN